MTEGLIGNLVVSVVVCMSVYIKLSSGLGIDTSVGAIESVKLVRDSAVDVILYVRLKADVSMCLAISSDVTLALSVRLSVRAAVSGDRSKRAGVTMDMSSSLSVNIGLKCGCKCTGDC